MNFLFITIPDAIRLSVQKPKSPTIYLRLRGGIGNQLFIYFAGLYYAEKLNMNLEIDTRGSDHKFDLSEFSLPGRFSRNKVYWKIVDLCRLRNKVILESEIEDYLDLNSQKLKSFQLKGFFQNSFYFLDLKNKGVEICSKDCHTLPGTFQNKTKGSALIHIRGGDYLTHKESLGCLSSEYYKEIMNILHFEKIKDLFVLTDDEAHAKRILSNFHENQIHYLEKGLLRDFECLAFFSSFNHIFLSNSTYSWWGAQIARSDCQVFAPIEWSKGGELKAEKLNLSDWKLIPSFWLD
jgi:hypothetical protein